MKTFNIAMTLATLTCCTTLPVLTTQGCLQAKPPTTAQQEQDAIAIAACVTAHWGEDWTVLLANCGSQGFAVFCDIVADIEYAVADKGTATPTASAAPKATLLAVKAEQDAGAQPAGTRKSYYANQSPIARRLAFKKQL